jgi:hypothetical protein
MRACAERSSAAEDFQSRHSLPHSRGIFQSRAHGRRQPSAGANRRHYEPGIVEKWKPWSSASSRVEAQLKDKDNDKTKDKRERNSASDTDMAKFASWLGIFRSLNELEDQYLACIASINLHLVHWRSQSLKTLEDDRRCSSAA